MSVLGSGEQMPVFQKAQAANSLSFQATLNCLGLVAKWTEALQGRGDVAEAISQVSQLTGADVVGLTSYSATKQSHANLAIVDRSAGKMFSSRRWEPYAHEILGAHLTSACEASLWTLTEIHSSAEFTRRRDFTDGVGQGLKEIVVIILEKSTSETIVLEFHYRLTPIPAGLEMLRLLAAALSDSWRNRLPGIPRRPGLHSVDSDGDLAQPSLPGPHILTHDNPMGLSRTEFRICMLLRDGMKSVAIADALGIGDKTVRGHLSTIYAKIGVSGQFELLHRLLGDIAREQERVVQKVG